MEEEIPRVALVTLVNGLTSIGLKMIPPRHRQQIKLQTVMVGTAPIITLGKVVIRFAHHLDLVVFRRAIEVYYEIDDRYFYYLVFNRL